MITYREVWACRLCGNEFYESEDAQNCCPPKLRFECGYCYQSFSTQESASEHCWWNKLREASREAVRELVSTGTEVV